jgi:hypothetical protein
MKRIVAELLFISRKHFVLLMFLALGLPLLAQSPTVITRMDWARAYGGPYEVYYQAVPTSLTDVDTRDAHLLGYCVSNSTTGALTFTIQTKDASPLPLPLTGSITANTAVCNNTPFGLLSKGGFSVQAGGAGLYYQAVWTH